MCYTLFLQYYASDDLWSERDVLHGCEEQDADQNLMQMTLATDVGLSIWEFCQAIDAPEIW